MRAGRGAGLCSVLAAAPCSLRRGEPRGWGGDTGLRLAAGVTSALPRGFFLCRDEHETRGAVFS